LRVRGPIVLASRNRGKLRELLDLASGALELVPLPDDPPPPEVAEDQPTYLGNATKKAVAIARFTGRPALADDSGLEVDALGGTPGVRSARYGGLGLDDAGRYRRLLSELAGVSNRRARFRCAVVLADGDDHVSAEGVVEGSIGDAPRGDGGFGYDPIFVVDGFGGRTMAELSRDEKNRVSHRARAMRALVAKLGVTSAEPSSGPRSH